MPPAGTISLSSWSSPSSPTHPHVSWCWAQDLPDTFRCRIDMDKMERQIPQFKTQMPSLCSAISSKCFPVFLLPVPASILERQARLGATAWLPPTRSFIPFETSLPPPPDIQLKSPSWKATSDFPWPDPDGLSLLAPPPPAPIFQTSCDTSDSAAHPFFPILGRVSGRFQLQIVRMLECVRPGYGQSPKFSFLICKMGLIKYVICVWHTTGLPSDPLFDSLSLYTHSAAKLIFLELMGLHHLRGDEKQQTQSPASAVGSEHAQLRPNDRHQRTWESGSPLRPLVPNWLSFSNCVSIVLVYLLHQKNGILPLSKAKALSSKMIMMVYLSDPVFPQFSIQVSYIVHGNWTGPHFHLSVRPPRSCPLAAMAPFPPPHRKLCQTSLKRHLLSIAGVIVLPLMPNIFWL